LALPGARAGIAAVIVLAIGFFVLTADLIPAPAPTAPRESHVIPAAFAPGESTGLALKLDREMRTRR
ncbi:MAG: hypothetical protein H7Y14_05630, partial [Burkholderiales bacterium]|nr:hypothetical protein [Burkholderiales bacterium]